MKVKVISLPYIFQALYVLCFTGPRYQVSVYRTIGPLVDSIILILAGNEDMHESLDEFKFRPDTDTITRVICPFASEKLLYNVVSTLEPSFLIGSSSYLQVKRTSITSRKSSKFGQIGPRTAELAALERMEKSP